MSKRSKTADRTLALDAYVAALRQWAVNSMEAIMSDAEALVRAAQADLRRLALKHVQRIFGRERAEWQMKLNSGRGLMASPTSQYYWNHCAPSISSAEDITVTFGGLSLSFELKVPDKIRNKWNPKFKVMAERIREINSLPSPTRGQVRDWQRAAVRKLMAENPELVGKVVAVIGEVAAKSNPDHWTAKVARTGQRTKAKRGR